jgi:hypothetical protein
MTAEQLGIGVSLTVDATIGGDCAIVHGRPLFTTQVIVTRGTPYWTAQPPENDIARPPPDGSTWPWVLKVSWRYPGRKHEGLMLAECRDLGVHGITEHVAHESSHL